MNVNLELNSFCEFYPRMFGLLAQPLQETVKKVDDFHGITSTQREK